MGLFSKQNKAEATPVPDRPALPPHVYAGMCKEIEDVRNLPNIEKTYENWAGYYQSGIRMNYKALASADDFRNVLRMSYEEARQSIFGIGGNEYLWSHDYVAVKQRYQYKLSLSFYQHTGVHVPHLVTDRIERLSQMSDDEAARWSRRRVGE